MVQTKNALQKIYFIYLFIYLLITDERKRTNIIKTNSLLVMNEVKIILFYFLFFIYLFIYLFQTKNKQNFYLFILILTYNLCTFHCLKLIIKNWLS